MALAMTTWTDAEQRVRADMRARARQGAERLDAVDPGWADRIDPVRLAMDDAKNCVVGQLVRHHEPDPISGQRLPWSAWFEQFECRRYPAELGFELSKADRDTDISYGALYRLLRDAWLHEIERRHTTGG
jgi:hypothetical protein